MSKLKLTLAALTLTFIAAQSSAQTSEPQPEPSTPSATDSVVGVWSPTYYACVSRYGAHNPRYPIYMEILHARTEFIMRSQIRNESCRMEGIYSIDGKTVTYQVKSQECATPQLAEQLRANVEQGQMMITLSSEIADKVCPANNSTLHVYMVRR